MPVLKGSTSTSALSTVYNNLLKITSFSLVNKAAGAVTVNVSIIYGSTNINIIELNKSLSTGQAYIYTGKPILLLPGYVIYVLVSGSTDYYFSLNNTTE